MPAEPRAKRHFMGNRFSAQRKIGQGKTRIARVGAWTLSICKNSVALSFERTKSKAGHFLPSKRHFFFCSDY
jgi:hypothetical protein